MLSFHVSIHARPVEVAPGLVVELGGRTAATLYVPREALATPLPLSFEEATGQLEQLPRLFIEPDGSFFWGSPQQEPAWQLDGNLFDRNGRLLFVDLKGSCPSAALDQLLTAIGWPAATVMFQLIREAVFLDEAAFRDWADV